MYEGGLSPAYVLDEAEMYELKILAANLYRRNQAAWEQSRMIAYITAQANSRKRLKAEDIISFDWDKKTCKGDTDISNADIERLRQKAKIYLKRK